jgi:hypothetical protein
LRFKRSVEADQAESAKLSGPSSNWKPPDVSHRPPKLLLRDHRGVALRIRLGRLRDAAWMDRINPDMPSEMKRPWTMAGIELLRTLAAKGKLCVEISEAMGRSYESTKNAAQRHGISIVKRKA